MLMTRLISQPASEPVTLAEAKDHLRIEHELDNAFITLVVKAAREHAEKHCWRGFVTQTWELVAERFPEKDFICLPKGTLASVTSVKYLDTDGAEQTLATSEYLVDTTSAPPRIRLAYGKSWPATRDQYNAVVVRYVVGSTVDAVPAPVKAAILLLAAQMYEFRTPEVLGTIVSKVGFTFDALLSSYRLRRF